MLDANFRSASTLHLVIEDVKTFFYAVKPERLLLLVDLESFSTFWNCNIFTRFINVWYQIWLSVARKLYPQGQNHCFKSFKPYSIRQSIVTIPYTDYRSSFFQEISRIHSKISYFQAFLKNFTVELNNQYGIYDTV